MRNVDLSTLYDAPVDPGTMQFAARPAKSCNGCLFQRQRVSVCRRAAELAVRAGMPDCDQGVIYILKQLDPRQIAIPEGEEE